MQVNNKQKVVLVAVIVLVVGMLLHPPFHYRYSNGRVENLGYAWLFDPPIVGDRITNIFTQTPTYTGTVDIVLLLVQWLGVLVVGAAAFLLVKDR